MCRQNATTGYVSGRDSIVPCLECHFPDLTVGPACLTCREKCRKCDRARPVCNRCIAKGLDCGGYPEQFRFCGIASRGKWKGAQLPVGGRTVRAHTGRVTRRQTRDSSTTERASGGTLKSPKQTQTSPILVRPIESPQDPSGEIGRILDLTETETLLSHCRRACFPRSMLDGRNNVAAQTITSSARIKFPRSAMAQTILTDLTSSPWPGSK